MKSIYLRPTGAYKSVALLALFFIAGSASAKTITYSLAFFNEDSIQIGRGYFSYDDATSDFIDTTRAYYQPAPKSFYVDRKLTSFSATIWGYTWGSNSEHWLPDDSTEAGEHLSHRYGELFYFGGWGFGYDPLEWVNHLELGRFIYNSLDDIWSGTWSASFIHNYWSTNIGGSWTAQLSSSPVNPAVPIPAALPLFASSLFLVGFVTRRRARA